MRNEFPPSLAWGTERDIMDLVFIGLMLFVAALTWGLLVLSEWLLRGQS